MGRIEKTVFISYRRTHFPWAYCIYQNLTQHGFDVFIDYQSIDSGNFESVILDNIRSRAHFVVILAPSALERCSKPGDWLRREIETAMDEQRNIIPVMLEGFDFGSPLAKKHLTGKLEALGTYNGLTFIAEYMEAGLEKLRKRHLNVALEDIHLHRLTAEAEEITRIQKAAADRAPTVAVDELKAQEWLERGYRHSIYFYREYRNSKTKNDLEEAIRCFTESIHLNPSYDAYFHRGGMYRFQGNLEDAIKDYDLAIDIDPKNAKTYNERGLVWLDRGDLDKAISDYNTAIRLDVNETKALLNRGTVRRIRGDLHGALADFNEALSRRGEDDYEIAETFYQRGSLLELMGASNDALEDYKSALNSNPTLFQVWASRSNLRRKLNENDLADMDEQAARSLLKDDDEYNQACLESLLGNVAAALKLLEVGLRKKQAPKSWVRNDTDFENVRDDPRFKELVGE
jgi:tetratricopeptide (TPR) repeat protein